MEEERYMIKSKKTEAKVQEHGKSHVSTAQALMK